MQLIRVKHWVKNFFIFTPAVFSGHFFETQSFYSCLFAFFGFCLVSSSVYIINDLHDNRTDQFHSEKKGNSFEGKTFLKILILLISLIFLGIGFLICYFVNIMVLVVTMSYFVINLAYTFFIKKIPFLDVILIAIGFQLRIWAGASAIFVEPSLWIQLCILFLALFLGFSKRRREIIILKDKAFLFRPVLKKYQKKFLDQLIIGFSFLTIVSYVLYSFFSFNAQAVGPFRLGFSSVFVAFGVVRYSVLIYSQDSKTDPGEIIFSEKIILLTVLLWAAYIIALFYI